MPTPDPADVTLRCADFDAALTAYTDELGFRLDMIFPADAPRLARLSGHGLTLHIERGNTRPREDGQRSAGGVIARAANDWGGGRARQPQRHLLTGRDGGRYIASHIRIPDGGPVPDYVHHHGVRFQLIFCRRGWVRVVYEDQGEPFVMREGDCVLQPPHIRHRVLESSAGMEVVETSSPAEHETYVDHELALPTSTLDPGREWDGQRFAHHRADGAKWRAWRLAGYDCRDTGIAAASGGRVGAAVVRANGDASAGHIKNDADFAMFFVLEGSAVLEAGAQHELRVDDCCFVATGERYRFSATSPDFAFFEVTSPPAA